MTENAAPLGVYRMGTREELHGLVDQLPDARTHEALACLRWFVFGEMIPAGSGATRQTERMEPPAVSGRDFFRARPKDIATLAAEQGVRPVMNFEDLLGDFWPEDGSADDFITAVRRWRRERGGC